MLARSRPHSRFEEIPGRRARSRIAWISSAQWFGSGSAPLLGGGLHITAWEKLSRAKKIKRWRKSMVGGDDVRLDAHVVRGSSWILTDTAKALASHDGHAPWSRDAELHEFNRSA